MSSEPGASQTPLGSSTAGGPPGGVPPAGGSAGAAGEPSAQASSSADSVADAPSAPEPAVSSDQSTGGSGASSSEALTDGDEGGQAEASAGAGGGLAMEGVAGAGDTSTAPGAAWQSEFPSFVRHEIASFSNGYYTSAFDIDGDGLRDVAALAAGGSEIVWFKNPSWERHTVTSSESGVICMDPHDVDGDGDLDLAFASEFSMTATSSRGTVYWAEAPDDPAASDAWELHAVGEIPTSHRVKWADIDADGNKELVVLPIFGEGSSSPEYVGPVRLTAFVAGDDATGEWTAEVLDDSRLEVAHALSVVDWDGDDADDLLTASNAGVHLYRPALGTEPAQLGVGMDGPRPDRGSSEVGVGTLDGERFFATVEPWHGTDLVIYTPSASEAEPWTRSVFGTEFGRGHALLTADLNADGYHEILAGDQGGEGALLIYRYVPSDRAWERIELDVGGISVVGMDIQDLDGDGDLDVIAIGGSSNNLVWYENSSE